LSDPGGGGLEQVTFRANDSNNSRADLDMRDLLTVIRYFRAHKVLLAVGIICVVVSTVVSLQIPLVVGGAIDDFRLGVTAGKLTRYGAAILGLSLVSGVFIFLQRRILFGVSRHVEHDLREDFFAHLQRMPVSFFQENRLGGLMAHATNDLNAVQFLAGPMIAFATQTFLFVALILPFMVRINLGLTLALLVPVPFALLVVWYFGRQIHARFRGVQEVFSEMTARLQENFSGVRVVRAYAQEEFEEAAFRETSRLYVEHNLGLARKSAMMRPLVQFLIGAGFLLVIGYGGSLVMGGEITIGQFTEFMLYLARLVGPLVGLGFAIGIYQRGMASLKRINAVFAVEPDIVDRPGVGEQPAIRGRVEFRDLTFSYGGRVEPVLRGIELVVEPGQTVAFVGRTGSGKSTLANLLPRLFEAPPDTLFIDGVSVRDYPLAQLRASIGYVPQESFLFSDTITENIAFGAREGSVDEVERAAEIAGLAEDVRGFPDGFDTLVGERGITLSGGQRQRTALARAVFRRPRILLLDDALSAVDTHTEAKILAQLRGFMRGRTSIVVSHRVSTVRDADIICVLNEGGIVERGRHDELLRLGGEYAALYERQLLEDEIASC
jgi:ATP-binding cassette subfamily B protein